MQRVFFTSWYSDNSAVYFYDISIFKNPQKKKYFWFRIQNDRKKKNQILFLAKFYVMFSILWDKKKESMSRKQAKFLKISANLFILENDPYAWILAFIADLYYV